MSTAELAEQKTELTPVPIATMMSRKTVAAMQNGICGTRDVYEPSADRESSSKMVRVSRERTPGQAFRSVVEEVYGVQRFCQDHNIPYQSEGEIDHAAVQLGISDALKEKVLESVDPAQCVPSIMYMTEGSELPVWNRLSEVAPDTYAATCPSSTQQMVSRQKDESTRIREAVEARGQSKPPVKIPDGYTPAPDNERTAEAIAFRDALSMGDLREWKAAVQIVEPFNVDRAARIQDFSDKFQRDGYKLDVLQAAAPESGGLTAGMADRLTEMKELLQPTVETARSQVQESMSYLFEKGQPTPDGGRKLEAVRLGFTIEGKDKDNFKVERDGKTLFEVKDGKPDALRALPPAIAVATINQVDYAKQVEAVQQMQAQVTQPAATKPKTSRSKKSAAPELE